MMQRARSVFLVVLSLTLLAAAHVPQPRGSLDPASSWRFLLTAAGCPPHGAHDLAVRIERLSGTPPQGDAGMELMARQVAQQITHLAFGEHGLRLTPSQLDAAIELLVGHPASSGGDRSAAADAVTGQPGSTAQAMPMHSLPAEPFTTRHAREALSEWLPSPGPR